jgi:hypothetical protein
MNTHQTYQQANVQCQPIMYNLVAPYPMLQPIPDQQVSTNYVAPMQHQTIPSLHNNPTAGYTSRQSQRLTSTSEEKDETQNNGKNDWQVIRSKKKNTKHNSSLQKQKLKHITDLAC